MAQVLPVIAVDWFAHYVHFVNVKEQLALLKHMFESQTSVVKQYRVFSRTEKSALYHTFSCKKIKLK